MSVKDKETRHRGSFTVKDFPSEERPRERLLAKGPEVLSNAELLAILVGTGNASTGETSLDLARRLLGFCGSLRGGDGRMAGEGLTSLVKTPLNDYLKIDGIGKAKAVQIKAAIELGRRLMRAEALPTSKVRSPSDLGPFLAERMRFLEKEHFDVVLLNTKNRILLVENVFVGSLDTSVVHPREIFKLAIKNSAASVIVAHNHPSGEPEPSEEDLRVTERLIEAGELLGIELLDHLVVGEEGFVSLRESYFLWDDYM